MVSMGALVDFIQRASFHSGLIRFARFEENSNHMWAIAADRAATCRRKSVVLPGASSFGFHPLGIQHTLCFQTAQKGIYGVCLAPPPSLSATATSCLERADSPRRSSSANSL